MNIPIKVATRNISSTFINPMEYFEVDISHKNNENNENNIITKLSNQFYKNVQKEYENNNIKDIKNFYKLVSALDKDFNIQRYSPLYSKYDIDLESYENFEYAFKNKTMKNFNDNIEFYNKILLKEMTNKWSGEYSDIKKFTNDVLYSIKIFDKLAIRSILEVSSENDVNPKDILTRLHSKIKSDEEKVDIIIDILQKEDLDLLFLQEMFEIPKEKLKQNGYTIFVNKNKNETTGIIFKQKFLDKINNKINDKNNNKKCKVINTDILNKKYDSELFQNCLIYKIDKIFFISLHFNSKNRSKTVGIRKNYEDQLDDLLHFLNILNKNNYKFIIGMDANHNFNVDKEYYLFPNLTEHKNVPTTNKTRTYIQSQLDKALKNDRGTKDHIMTNIKNINNKKVLSADGTIIYPQNNSDYHNIPLLPNPKDIFDHFGVYSTIVL